ncbi:MAG TPA: hypothetical protein V6D00_09935 [Pantanalinema sp.]
MRHRRDIRLIAALAGLTLAGSFPALAAAPVSKRIESERRQIPAVNQGQKGYWVEYEEYTYRYDPWREELLKVYKELFKVETSFEALDRLIQRVHRGEMTSDQGLAAIRALHQALSANRNNPKAIYGITIPNGTSPITIDTQPVEFELIDKHFGAVWQGGYDDKRKTMELIYAKGHYQYNAYKRSRPITASTFAEVSRLARIIESIDLGIPFPVSTLMGEVLAKRGKYDASGQSYSMAITRENLVAKMKELFAVGVNLDPNLTWPRRESDFSPYGAMNGAPNLPPLD